MGKPQHKLNPRAIAIMDDLDLYRDFCVEYGYRFREEDLYNFKSYAWQQYNNYSKGNNANYILLEYAIRLVRPLL